MRNRSSLHGFANVGHPVDVASGAVYVESADVRLPGMPDAIWSRLYDTRHLLRAPAYFGPGWSNIYSATLVIAGDALVFDAGAAGDCTFADALPALRAGGVVRDAATSRELGRKGPDLAVTEWRPMDACVRRYIFRAAGGELRLAVLEFLGLNAIDIEWDTQGRLSTLRDRLFGRTLIIESNRAGRIEAISLALTGGGSHVLAHYEYDASGGLAAAYNALDVADHYSYDAAGRLTREITRDSGVFDFHYDDESRCVWTSGIGGFDEKHLDYRRQIGWTFVTDSHGEVWRYQWIESGQVITVIDPLGGVSRMKYDDLGRIVARIDPLGATEKLDYDDAGNLSTVTDPAGGILAFKYNSDHLPVELTDKAGNKTTRQYDGEGQATSIVNPDGGSWEAGYTSDGRLAFIKDALGAVETYEYPAPNTSSVALRNGGVETVVTDALGNLSRHIDPLGHVVTYTHDALCHLTRVDYPDGSSRQFSYDAAGNLVRLIDGNGHIHVFRYGTCGRILEQIDPVGNRLTFEWDTEPDELVAVMNQRGEIYRYRYDACGRVVEEIGFDGRRLGFQYNAAGNCIASVNALGQVTEFDLDPVGRVLRASSPDDVAIYSYNSAGQMLTAENRTCAVSFEYNSLGGVSRETRDGHAIVSEYNLLGRRTCVKSTLGAEFRFDYDAEERLARAESNRWMWRFECDRGGREVALTMPGNIRLEQDWDSAGRLAAQRLQRRKGGVTRHQRRMKYDQTSNVVVLDDSRWGKTVATYDSANRPVRTGTSRGWEEEFDYTHDCRIAVRRTAGRSQTFAYAEGGRLMADGDYVYEYDGQGRVTAKAGAAGQFRFEWNTADRLAGVSANGHEWRYEYDAFGRRVRKIGPGGTVEYVWDGTVPLHELEGKSGAVTIWLFDPVGFRPLARVAEAGTVSFVSDFLGLPQLAVDNTGEISWHAAYNVWGEVRESAGDPSLCPVRFAGQWLDPETGLHYNLHRYYDPGTAGYLSPDPVRLLGGAALYAYSTNPMRWVDPFGLNTPPSLPPRDVVAPQNGVSIVHNYGDMNREHADPIHFHVQHQGGETRVRADGTPLPGEPALSKQAKGLLGQKSTISAMRRAEKRIARVIRATGARPGGRPFKPGNRGEPKKKGGCGK